MAKHSTARSARQRFGDNLRVFRVLKGLSQDQLAVDSGVYRSHLGRIERGQLNLTLDTMVKLAEAVGRDVHDLLDPNIEPPRRRVESAAPPTNRTVPGGKKSATGTKK